MKSNPFSLFMVSLLVSLLFALAKATGMSAQELENKEGGNNNQICRK